MFENVSPWTPGRLTAAVIGRLPRWTTAVIVRLAPLNVPVDFRMTILLLSVVVLPSRGLVAASPPIRA